MKTEHTPTLSEVGGECARISWDVSSGAEAASHWLPPTILHSRASSFFGLSFGKCSGGSGE